MNRPEERDTNNLRSQTVESSQNTLRKPMYTKNMQTPEWNPNSGDVEVSVGFCVKALTPGSSAHRCGWRSGELYQTIKQ